MGQELQVTTISPPDSRVVWALDRWQLSDPNPPATKAQLLTLITTLSASLAPAGDREYATQLLRLRDFAKTFGIPVLNGQKINELYRKVLGPLPADLLAKAMDSLEMEWRWSNRMPFPAEILTLVAGEHLKRRNRLWMAQQALRRCREPRPRADAATIDRLLKERARALKSPYSSGRDRKATPSEQGDTPDPELARQWAELRDELERGTSA